jgi:hypothetical protein
MPRFLSLLTSAALFYSETTMFIGLTGHSLRYTHSFIAAAILALRTGARFIQRIMLIHKTSSHRHFTFSSILGATRPARLGYCSTIWGWRLEPRNLSQRNLRPKISWSSIGPPQLLQVQAVVSELRGKFLPSRSRNHTRFLGRTKKRPISAAAADAGNSSVFRHTLRMPDSHTFWRNAGFKLVSVQKRAEIGGRNRTFFRFEFKSSRLEHLFSKGFQRQQLETLFVETFFGDLFEIFYERDSGVEREALEPRSRSST